MLYLLFVSTKVRVMANCKVNRGGRAFVDYVLLDTLIHGRNRNANGKYLVDKFWVES